MITIRYTQQNRAPETVDVPAIDVQRVKLCTVNGLPTAEVRETHPEERAFVVDAPYAASWLGWHYGQVPAYGRTPKEAVEKLAAGQYPS
jgi:hypothetical protein